LEQRLARAAGRFRLPAASAAGAARLAGDAGSRQYYRLRSSGGGSVLVVLYPEPESAAQRNWTAIGLELKRAGLRVPELHDDAPEDGAALIEDLGDRDLAAEIHDAPAEDRGRLVDEAEDLLVPIRSISREVADRNPPFDAAFFHRELTHTRRWALERDGATPLSGDQADEWERLATSLAQAAADPASTGDAVATHRDFHANNLMRASDGRLAPIDFQDLRLGPPDYDPVSLRFERAGEDVGSDPGLYAEAVLLQRAWKVLGTFEKMLLWGREVYRPHRDRAVRVIRGATPSTSPFAPLLTFLPPNG